MKVGSRSALALALLASACLGGEDEDHPDETALFEQSFLEKDDVKADSTGCSGVRVPDRPNGAVVALTFDDGPNAQTTPQVLEILRRHDVPATFFINGNRVTGERERAILADVARDSRFLLANHSQTHKNLATLSIDSVGREIDRTAAILGSSASRYFRFPFGSSTCDTMELVRHRQLSSTGWHIDSADWCFAAGHGVCRPETFRYVPDLYRGDMVGWIRSQTRSGGTKQGGIILFHDIHANTADNLDAIITMLKDDGFRFARLDDTTVFPRLNGASAGRFIGDACSRDADCTFPGGMCLTDFPGGYCTSECTTSCPDRDGYPVTRCVAAPSELSMNLCTIECASGTCRDGFACTPASSPSGASRQVCWPDP